MTQFYDAVIVGSGFGGSIAALRLAQAGKSVLVLERGKRYPLGGFPRDVRDIDRLFWDEKRRVKRRGLFEFRSFSGIGAVVAAGVGGGSLIYANIHIRPDARLFDDPRWPGGFTRESLDPYYDRVAGMLGIEPLPKSIPVKKRDVFIQVADAMGVETFDPNEAVAWIQAPGDGRSACKLCGECEFGCQFGAKNTLDYNYLPQAEALGARIVTDAVVSHVEPSGQGYKVHYRDLERGESAWVEGARAVLSAGTLGTNEILFRSRDRARTLPKLSAMLGHGYSGNGDFLGSIQNSATELEPWHGPDVTTVMNLWEQLGFTMAGPTFNRPVMDVLASLGQPNPPRWLRPLLKPLWSYLDCVVPWLFRKGLLSQPAKCPGRNAGPSGRMTNLFAIGRDNAGGRIVFKNDRIDIQWDYAKENAALIADMEKTMRQFADGYGGTFEPLGSWLAFQRILTVHSMGGCRLAETPEQGVVSTRGEVFGYPGLFVADGSVIPTSIGFHPVMTISAVAERIAEQAAQSY
jgi:cholesterol oxidase